MRTIKNNLILATGLTLAVFTSCKKNDEMLVQTPPPSVPASPTTPSTTPPPTGSSADIMKDSALSLSRDIYLWNSQIPATFNARGYSDLNKVMEAIRPYSSEPGFSSNVDRWSFAMKKSEWDQVSGGMGTAFSSSAGVNGDFGITVFFRAEGDLRVRLVEPNSPAGQSGVRRGWKITAINGNTNITTSNANYIVDNIYNAVSSSVTFLKPDGNTVNLNLSAGHYAEKPVYLDTVYNINNKKIGYLVFNSFLGNQAQVQGEFNRVFSGFASAGITELVVDLRYNGGGYVDLQSKLANYLINSSANGQLMMKQVYNTQNSQHNQTTNFQKAGSLNLSDIYFIVGRGTASASELLINNLKPYMDVKLIGGTTHGKPVGYFPIPVEDWYIFPVSFRTTNKNNEGNYFNGFPVNAQVADGLDKDWGDITESSLASAIMNITTGSYSRSAPYNEPVSVANGNKELESSLLKLSIDTKNVF